ncbi:MAG: hypothetical protein ACR2M0_02045 [Chloroflexia bacterium]
MASTSPDPIRIRPTPPDWNDASRQPGRFWGLVARVAALTLLLLGVGWLLMREQAGVNYGPGATPTANPAPASAQPHSTDPYGYRFSTMPMHADSNMVVISFTIAPPTDRAQYPTPLSWASQAARLSAEGSTDLPPLEGGIGWSTDPMGRIFPGPAEISMAFDARNLHATGAVIPLRLTMNLFGHTSVGGGGPFRLSTPVPTQPVMQMINTQIQFEQLLRVPFDARRIIAEPGTRSESGGVAVTLDRVVVTASETRFYSHMSYTGNARLSPWSLGLTLHGDSWTIPTVYNDSGGGNPTDGSYVFRIETNLLDKPSPWTLTLPPVSPAGPQGLPQNPPAPESGPWVFLFSVPPVSTSATPGAAPTLRPGLTPVPNFPWGVPTTGPPPLGTPSLTHEPIPPGGQGTPLPTQEPTSPVP